MDGMTTSGMPTNLTHDFSRVPSVEKPRSTFERSSAHKMTFDPNVIFPVYYDQIYPGDTMQLVGNLFARLLSPLKVPIMDNIYLDWFAFFIPERLVWNNFQASMGEQANPGDPTNFLIPVVDPPAGGWTLHSLGDYFHSIGAILGGGGVPVNAMLYRSYNKTILDWFHDQNLQNSPPQNRGDGPDNPADYTLFNRRKRLDYFTSLLPFAMKGTPPVLNIGGNASVIFPSNQILASEDVGGGNSIPLERAGYTAGGGGGIFIGGQMTQPAGANPLSSTSVGAFMGLPLPGDAYADLSTAVGITLNEFRLFVTTQQFLEINARSGTRYIESNLAHFGVVSPDARLQRSEFLAGGTISVTSHPIAQTSGTGVAGSTPQGTLTAFGTLSGNVNASHSFVEHGYVLILAESRADLTYWQGIAHFMFERSQLDRYYPVFSNIGEQGILSRELYCTGAPQDLDILGYLPPFEHLRYKPSTLGGYFRPDAPGSLDFYHVAQDFGAVRPTLNSTYIGDNMPIGRVVASATSPYFILDSWFVNKTTRVLPVFSVPGLVRL